jgi:Raf kinase inhibitor-like YbhB/YbcL family protein
MALSPPPDIMTKQGSQGIGVPLVNERIAPAGKDAIELSSATIKADGAIPNKHSDYADGVSPPLAWSPVKGAKSYAIITEDPDAKPITPFVHWVVWNIPGESIGLPEGLQEQPRLTDPDGVLQGRTSRGVVGYFGPRPPVGDKPHHYHFQILALDTTLDVPPGADRDQVLKAAEGHVMAKGELIGTYAQEVRPPK